MTAPEKPLPSPADISALHRAVERGDIAAINASLDKYGDTIINSPGRKGQTALTFAVMWQQADVARLLLDRGAAIDQPDEDGATPLIRAAQWGYSRMAALLVERGADVNRADSTGQTVLEHAVRFGNDDTTQLLYKKGALDAQQKIDQARIEKLKSQRPPKPVLKRKPFL